MQNYFGDLTEVYSENRLGTQDVLGSAQEIHCIIVVAEIGCKVFANIYLN